MRRRLLVPLAAVLALAVPTTAASAATWGAPQTVSAPHTFQGPLITATAFDGSALIAWPWQDNAGNDAIGGDSTAARPSSLDPSTPFGSERAAPSNVTAIAPYARTQVIALAQDGLPGRSGATGAILYHLNIAFGPSTGGFAAPRTLVTAPVVSSAQLATSGTTALVTWIEVTKTSSGAIRRVVRAIDRAHGAWGKAYTLSGRGRADTISAAASTNGDQVVAFSRQGKLLVRVRRHGRGWGALRTLATAVKPTQWQIRTAIDARGQVRVVWRRHELRTRTALGTSALLVGRSAFTEAQTLAADGASADFHLTTIPQGWAIADVEANTPVLRRTLGGSRFGAPQPAAPAAPGLRGADVTWSPVAGVTVAWVEPRAGQDGDGSARSASYDNGAWTAPEDVSPPEAVHEVRLLTDGRAGQPLAIWTARPAGTGPQTPIAQIRTVVRASLRRP